MCPKFQFLSRSVVLLAFENGYCPINNIVGYHQSYFDMCNILNYNMMYLNHYKLCLVSILAAQLCCNDFPVLFSFRVLVTIS